jgi:hypothetical protein
MMFYHHAAPPPRTRTHCAADSVHVDSGIFVPIALKYYAIGSGIAINAVGNAAAMVARLDRYAFGARR